MPLELLAQDRQVRHRLYPLLIGSGLTQVAALALVVASLALGLDTDPASPPTQPIQFGPPAGHATVL